MCANASATQNRSGEQDTNCRECEQLPEGVECAFCHNDDGDGSHLLPKEALKEMPDGRSGDLDGGYDAETDEWIPYGDGADTRGDLSRLAPEELIENRRDAR